MPRKRLGELLLERKVITPTQLDQALAYQRQTGHRLGAALVALGLMTEGQLCEALAHALGLQAVAMPPAEVDWTALHSLRSRFCEANDLFPLSVDAANPNRKSLTVAMADPLNIPAIEEIEFTTGFKVVPVIAPLSGIRAAIRRYYLKEIPGQPPHQMTVMRAGGTEQVIPDTPRSQAPRRGAPVARTPRTEENELPVLTDNELVEVREVTERTALADLIKDRAERRRRKRAKAGTASVDEDLAYLFGVKSETPSEELAQLEVKFWALLRIMAKKGLISREEFMKEIADRDD
jgi:hypothetical protein